MTAIGIQEVGAVLPGLIGRIAGGEQILVTEGGEAVAMIGPPPGAADRVTDDVAGAVRDMLAWRDRHGPTLGPGLTVRELIDAGRRF